MPVTSLYHRTKRVIETEDVLEMKAGWKFHQYEIEDVLAKQSPAFTCVHHVSHKYTSVCIIFLYTFYASTTSISY